MPLDGVTYRTSPGTGVKWETGKGANLTPTEVDDNFWELYSRLKLLEDNPPTAAGISNIEVIGSQLQIFLSDSTVFGPFTLPIAVFELRGDYVPGTHYYELDLISVPQQGLFLVRVEHDGEDPFDPDAVDGGANAMYLKLFGENTYIYDIGWFYPGRPGNGIAVGGIMASHALVRAITLPIGLAGSVAKLSVASATALSFPLFKNATSIGSINFAIGAVTATFTFAAAVSFAIGDKLRMGRPTAIDTDARELDVSLLATRIT